MEKHLTPENAHTLLQVTQSTVYLMGASFVLGSLFTLLLLLLLDFTRRNKPQQ
ncbi:MAG: hypothetical protein KGI29_01285 [Pseudomonadota bacterium]|nr:hypothetical protein [Pseudomonadota bacterium]MDE3037393.1 hypothetical protein [Pseudomonadota bacterium]